MKVDKLTIQEMVLGAITFGCFGSHIRSLETTISADETED